VYILEVLQSGLPRLAPNPNVHLIDRLPNEADKSNLSNIRADVTLHLLSDGTHLQMCLVCCLQMDRLLISLACVTNNAFHLWLNTSFEGKTIITPEALQHVPLGIHGILLLVKDNISAIYVREPLPSGKDCIHKL